ncbi:BatE protein [Flavobacterium rivuli WB 3.3-2 = DSM 21788]|uniref:BatE protein n=2 Tax=Flavobacterium rivuli TaxID=498301 RepID=A0A0A2LZC4_9FLAO|nr:tetratricopeptide repeat protein [Flavobacterium rivuli]KGO85697.1 BatE protein [Flavobacterium rivuli WB 3.3-2 = DSM 21788]
MKKLLYIVLLLVTTQAAFAQSFDKGNELYRKGDYAGAAQQYEGVLKQKQESSELYFNLGNAYYKLDNVAPAIFNYEKALQLNPGNKDTEVNLSHAQKLVIDDIKQAPKVGLSKMLYGITGTYHYNTWAWVAVSFSGFFILLFLGYYLVGTTLLKRIFFTGMCLAVLCSLFSILAAAFVRSQEAGQNPAIVYAEVVSIKSEPSASAKDAFILHEGTKVNIKETVGNWSKVVLADDSVGWVEKDAIRALK